jgi:hypothetical protein
MLILLPGTAAAQDGADGTKADQVVLTGRLEVPQGETVQTAVIFDGDATIDGTVAETLVVFNGTAEIRGVVRLDVVVFNGDVVLHDGAEVGRDVYSRSTPRIDPGATVGGQTKALPTRFDLTGLGFAGRFAWWVAYSVSALILGLLVLLLVPGADRALAGAWRTRSGLTVGSGLGVFFLVPVAAGILIAIIVAIPLGLFTLLALGLIYTVGYVAGALVVGRLLVQPPASRYVALLLGLAIVRGLALIPAIGGLVWTIVAILGLGALFAAARGGARPASTPAVPPVPPTPA